MAAIKGDSYGPEMDSIPASPLGRLSVLEQFAREQTHDDRILLAALLPLIPVAHAEAVRRGDPDFAYGLLRQALDILWDFKHALAPPDQKDAYYGRLWRHSDNFPNPLKEEAWSPDQEAVEAVAASYLDCSWMSAGYLEWALVDALTRREILAYEAHVALTLPRPWTSAWATQKALTVWAPWLIEIAILVASVGWLWSEFSSDAPYRWWWAAGIGAYYVWWIATSLINLPARIRRRRERRKGLLATTARLQAMRRCYAELDGPVLDPTRVQNILLAAEKLEVRWSCATWPLLEAAIARHPHRWTTGY